MPILDIARNFVNQNVDQVVESPAQMLQETVSSTGPVMDAPYVNVNFRDLKPGFGTFDDFINSDRVMEAKQIFANRGNLDLNTLWQAYNFLYNAPLAIQSNLAFWNEHPEARIQIQNDIGNALRAAFPNISLIDILDNLDYNTVLTFTSLFLPELNELGYKMWMQKDLEGWFKATIDANKTLPTQEQRNNHIEIVKGIISRNAPDNWQELINPTVVSNALKTFYQKELGEIDSEFKKADAIIETATAEELAVRSAKNAKLIGIGIAGIFGIVLISKVIKK